MRAFVITGPRASEVAVVAEPVPRDGEAVVDVHRVGVCGTDAELFTGEMAYVRSGIARYPLRVGHEWCGTVAAVGGAEDAPWIGRRVTADTMVGCGSCRRCQSGRHHLCPRLSEIGIQGPYPGALAERILVPVRSLHALPDRVDDAGGAMVEPGGNAWRSLDAAALVAGERLLVLGPGTIGLLVALLARARGIEVHLLARPGRSFEFARSLGFAVWHAERPPDLPFDAIVDASNSPSFPARALELVEPGRRVVCIGLSGDPSLIDSRMIVLREVTVVGILGASAGLAPAIEAYASGRVDPRPLVAATVGLDEVGPVLEGWRPSTAGPGPKIHVDPRR